MSSNNMNNLSKKLSTYANSSSIPSIENRNDAIQTIAEGRYTQLSTENTAKLASYQFSHSITAKEMISQHHLQKMGPEGIWLNETYRSTIQVTPGDPYDGKQVRNAAAKIEFLLEKGHVSIWHTQKCDETWTYFCGSRLHIHIINTKGDHNLIKLGNPDLYPDYVRHFTIKAEGQYIAAELASEATEEFFFGTAITSPGFEFQDANFNVTEELISNFPSHEILIKRLASNDA
jgi:uncharacterized protein